jgi:hypothetical protein
MSTVVASLDRIARQCSLGTPANWITASEDEYKEIRDDFLLECVDDLLRRVDWADPISKLATISGDGSEDYDLPADFRRLQNDRAAVYETANVRRTGTPVTTEGQWTHIKELGTGAGHRYYRLRGYDGNYQISFYPNPTSGESIKVHYVSDLWMANSSGTPGSAFTDADDVLLLPRTMIETGVVYRWRLRKGLEYMDVQREHEFMIAEHANRSNVVRKVSFGPTQPTSPWQIPIPDFIPDS